MDRNMIDYLPSVLRDVREYKEILEAHETEISDLWGALEDALKEQFVSDATETGILRFEKILDIAPKAADTLDDRKFRILARFNEELPYTYNGLKERLITLCGEDGFTMELFHATYTLKVRIELTVRSQFDTVESLLDRITPANLIIDISLRYNQQVDYETYTHGDLTAYTHTELREGVIS